MAVVEQVSETERRAMVDDAAQQIAKLGILIHQLEPEAKGDKRILQELATLESERRAAEGVLRDLLEGARSEQDAREAEAAEAEAGRQAHLSEARRLGAGRVKAAAAVDAGLAQFAVALEAYHRTCQLQANKLAAAGNGPARDAARPRGYRVNAAMAYALRQAKTPVAAIDLSSVSPSTVKPLAESDPVPVEVDPS